MPLVLELVRAKLLTPAAFVTRLSAAPAALFGLPGGSLAAGAPADVTVVDPEASLDLRAGGHPLALAQHALRRPRAHGTGGVDHRRRCYRLLGGENLVTVEPHPSSSTSSSELPPALLAMEDGTVYRGFGFGAADGGDVTAPARSSSTRPSPAIKRC